MGFPASALKQKIPGTSCKGLVEVGGGLSSMIRFGGTFNKIPLALCAFRSFLFSILSTASRLRMKTKNPWHCVQGIG